MANSTEKDSQRKKVKKFLKSLKKGKIPDFIIPPEVALNKHLDKSAILLFSVIERLDHPESGCFASSKYLSNVLNTSITNIQQTINRLIAEGYVKEKTFEGRRRIIRINKNYPEIHRKLIKEITAKIKNQDCMEKIAETFSPEKSTEEKQQIRKTIIRKRNNKSGKFF